MNRKTFASAALALVMALLLSIPAFAAKATYTMTFTEGIKLINPLTGKKPTQIFTGTDVPSITVEEGGSFVFPENTIIFRDYIFSGWKYIYTDENGEKKAKIYQPGDTFENVGSDIEFGAYWTRPVPIDLVITGFLTFANNEPYSEGELPDAMQVVYNSTVKLKKLSLSKDGYTFRGWVDSRRTVLRKRRRIHRKQTESRADCRLGKGRRCDADAQGRLCRRCGGLHRRASARI